MSNHLDVPPWLMPLIEKRELSDRRVRERRHNSSCDGQPTAAGERRASADRRQTKRRQADRDEKQRSENRRFTH
jgi:hypothetical protein